MSVLTAAAVQGNTKDAILSAARPVFAAAIWSWFNNNKNRVIFRKWFFSITVGDFRIIIEELAGPEPTTTP